MPDGEVRFVRVTSCYPSWARGRQRCFRIGQKGQKRRGDRIELEGKVVNLVPPGVQWEASHVYMFQLSPDLRERWPKQPARQYVVCLTDDGVEKYLQDRYGKIARKNMGAAKMALGIASAKVSTRPQRVTNPGQNAKRTAARAVDIRIEDTNDVYTVSVDDRLSYAVSAVKGGRAAIDVAMMKAANRVAGHLRSRASAPLKASLATPFPEVARRR